MRFGGLHIESTSEHFSSSSSIYVWLGGISSYIISSSLMSSVLMGSLCLQYVGWCNSNSVCIQIKYFNELLNTNDVMQNRLNCRWVRY